MKRMSSEIMRFVVSLGYGEIEIFVSQKWNDTLFIHMHPFFFESVSPYAVFARSLPPPQTQKTNYLNN